jgi:hypothetical protein
MNKVFLSHSSKDKPFVLMLAGDICASGIGVWIDNVEILVGDSLIRKISEGIVESNYVVACLSSNSIESNWVREELEIAATLGINGNRVVVLPVIVDDCAVPTFLAHRLYVDFRQPAIYDQSCRELLRRIAPSALPQTDYSFYSLTLGDTRKDRLVQAAKNPPMKRWVLDYLMGMLSERASHKERYWTYIALGEIGGKQAEAAVQAGLLEQNKYALSGAKAAWAKLGN